MPFFVEGVTSTGLGYPGVLPSRPPELFAAFSREPSSQSRELRRYNHDVVSIPTSDIADVSVASL